MKMNVSQATGAPGGRVLSLDALRGFDMFWIIGGDTVCVALLRLIGSPGALALTGQFEHAAWNGFTFWDLIYPLFLFIVGASMPFAISRRLERGQSRREITVHIVKRFLTLLFLGYIFNGLLDFPRFSEMRHTGVLHRIAWCYLITGFIMLRTGWRGQAITGAALLLVYWALMALAPVPGFGAGVITPEGNFSSYVDRLLLPGYHNGYNGGDYLGILGTIPSIASTLAGVLAGHLLRSSLDGMAKVRRLALWGAVSVAAAWLWNLWLPVNKFLWTSSYTLCGAGISAILLALFYWLIDLRGISGWTLPFVVIGLNPITIYVAQRLFDFGTAADIFIHGITPHLGDFGQLFRVTCVLAVKWLFLYFLHRQKIYLKA